MSARERAALVARLGWPIPVAAVAFGIETSILVEPMNELLGAGEGFVTVGAVGAFMVTFVGSVAAHLRGRGDVSADDAAVAGDDGAYARAARMVNLWQLVLVAVALAALGARMRTAQLAGDAFDLWAIGAFVCFQFVLFGLAIGLPRFAIENHRTTAVRLLDSARATAAERVRQAENDAAELKEKHQAQLDRLDRGLQSALRHFFGELADGHPLPEVGDEWRRRTPVDDTPLPGGTPRPGRPSGDAPAGNGARAPSDDGAGGLSPRAPAAPTPPGGGSQHTPMPPRATSAHDGEDPMQAPESAPPSIDTPTPTFDFDPPDRGDELGYGSAQDMYRDLLGPDSPE